MFEKPILHIILQLQFTRLLITRNTVEIFVRYSPIIMVILIYEKNKSGQCFASPADIFKHHHIHTQDIILNGIDSTVAITFDNRVHGKQYSMYNR